MNKQNKKCPRCDSEEFITEPNQYSILIFTEDGFVIQNSEYIDEYKIFCRACYAEIDTLKSLKKVVIKKTKI